MKKIVSSAVILVLMPAVLLQVTAPPAEPHEDDAEKTANEMEQLRKEVKELEEKVEHMDKHLIHRPETEAQAHILDGFKLGLGLTGVVQGSSGADDLAGKDQTDASGSLDIEVQKTIGDHGTAFLLIESRQGAGLTDAIETLHGVNADAADDDGNFKITEVWYEHDFGEVPLILTLGKVDLTNYFDANTAANDETLQFLANGFVNNIAVEFPVDNGPGFRVAYLPSERVEIGLGVADSDTDFEDVGRDPFGILEFSYRPRFGGREGNYRIYSWINGRDHQEWKDPLKDDKKNWGLGISLDQAFSRNVTGFLRAGIQDESVSRIHTAVSLGAEFRGLFPKRDKDILGIALGIALLSDEYEDSVAPLKLDNEQMMEAYYSFHINDHLIISPDIQVVRNPGGLGDADTITVPGVRAQVLF